MIVIERRRAELEKLNSIIDGGILELTFDTAKEANSYKFKMYQTMAAIRENPEYSGGEFTHLPDAVSVSWRRRKEPTIIRLIKRTHNEVQMKEIKQRNMPSFNFNKLLDAIVRDMLDGGSGMQSLDIGIDLESDIVEAWFDKDMVTQFQRRSRTNMSTYAKETLGCKALRPVFMMYQSEEGKLIFTINKVT